MVAHSHSHVSKLSTWLAGHLVSVGHGGSVGSGSGCLSSTHPQATSSKTYPEGQSKNSGSQAGLNGPPIA